MVRIVKPQKHYRMQPVAVNQTKCYKCGAELEYTESECERQQSHMYEWQYYITCPCCGNRICVDCKNC